MTHIKVDFHAESCTMSADGVLVSAQSLDGLVDIQLKLTVGQALDLDTELRRQLLMVDLEDV